MQIQTSAVKYQFNQYVHVFFKFVVDSATDILSGVFGQILFFFLPALIFILVPLKLLKKVILKYASLDLAV